MWTLAQLTDKEVPQVYLIEIDEWVPARPLSGPFVARLKDAWKVLKGRADAFTWPEDELR